MSDSERDRRLADLAGILLWSFAFTMALLLVWFLYHLAAADWIHSVHSRWFDITPRDFDLAMYSAMAAVKILGIVFFLIPGLAIQIVRRRGRTSAA